MVLYWPMNEPAKEKNEPPASVYALPVFVFVWSNGSAGVAGVDPDAGRAA